MDQKCSELLKYRKAASNSKIRKKEIIKNSEYFEMNANQNEKKPNSSKLLSPIHGKENDLLQLTKKLKSGISQQLFHPSSK